MTLDLRQPVGKRQDTHSISPFLPILPAHWYLEFQTVPTCLIFDMGRKGLTWNSCSY